MSDGLAQGPYVAARAGVEPTTLRLKAIDSTNAPSRPTQCIMYTQRIHNIVYLCIEAIYIDKMLKALSRNSKSRRHNNNLIVFVHLRSDDSFDV